MAIARAGTPVDGGNNGGSTSSLTFSVTVPSGASLFVGFAGPNGGGADDISSVVFNTSENLTLLKKNVNASLDRLLYLYWIAAPTATTANVVITAASSHYLLGGAAMYTGMQAASQPDASTTNQATTNSLTTTLTTVADNCWTIAVGGHFDSNTLLGAGAGTSRVIGDNAFGTWAIFDSNAAITPAGSTSLIFTHTNGAVIGSAMVSMAPDTGGGGPTPRPFWTNLGARRVA